MEPLAIAEEKYGLAYSKKLGCHVASQKERDCLVKVIYAAANHVIIDPKKIAELEKKALQAPVERFAAKPREAHLCIIFGRNAENSSLIVPVGKIKRILENQKKKAEGIAHYRNNKRVETEFMIPKSAVEEIALPAKTFSALFPAKPSTAKA
ncbi:MAG: hypothetical protein WC408_05320 [Candidatus Micrarchaeia archaeon]|jgi:hypothetical protein